MATYILPGMGADASMYGKEFTSLDDVQYLNWPHFGQKHSITSLAKKIIRENTIQENDIVGGSSLGGIVAAEIARHVKPRKLILIGSTLTSENINPALKKLRALSPFTPVALAQAIAGKIDTFHSNTLFKMFSQSDSLFIKNMCTAVFEWEGNNKPDCSVAHIHGARDHINYPSYKGETIIQDGSHLLAMTHESLVVQFVRVNIA